MVYATLMEVLQRSKIWLAFLLMALMVTGMVYALPATVHANAKKDICISAGNTWSNGTCTAKGVSAQDAIETVINVLSYIVGVAAVIMIIFGGFRYVTSGGDANASKTARSTILYAIVGLVIVVIAQAIVFFVLGSF